MGSLSWKDLTGNKQGQWEALKPDAKDYLMNRVRFCHNLDQVERNDWSILYQHTHCFCEKHLKRDEIDWHGHVTDNLAHHLHIAAYSVSACLDSLSRVHVIQHGCFLKGAVLVLLSDSRCYFVTMGRSWGGAWGQSSWSKYTPWHVHETSTRWQICSAGTEAEMNGCQLAVLKGCF